MKRSLVAIYAICLRASLKIALAINRLISSDRTVRDTCRSANYALLELSARFRELLFSTDWVSIALIKGPYQGHSLLMGSFSPSP